MAARNMAGLALTVCCLLNQIASRTCSTEAWIPTGHICRQRRIIFGQETFMVGKSKLQSTATNDNDAATGNPPPPPTLSFLDARYADLFRRTDGHGVIRPQHKHQQGLLARLRKTLGIMSKDVSGTDEDEHLLIRTHSRVRIGQRSADGEQQKRRPIVRLDPATGLYITERSQPTLAVTKSEDAVAAAVTTDNKSTSVLNNPVASTSEASQEAPKSALTQDTEATDQLQLAASTKDATDSSVQSSTDADDLVLAAQGNPSSIPPTQDDNIQLLAEQPSVLATTDLVSSTDDNVKDSAELQKAKMDNLMVETEAKNDTPLITMEVSTVELPDSSSTLPTTATTMPCQGEEQSNALDEDKKNLDVVGMAFGSAQIATDTAVDISANLSPEALSSKSTEIAVADTQLTFNDDASTSDSSSFTLSEQGARVVKSATEAASKIAFLVGKAAYRLAVIVTKAALALDENKRPPRLAIDDDLDKDVQDVLDLAERALASGTDSPSHPPRRRNIFLGWFSGLGDKLKFVFTTEPNDSVSKLSDIASIKPHPPSPPLTLEAFRELESNIMNDVTAIIHKPTTSLSANSITQLVATPEDSKRENTPEVVLHIRSAVKKAKEAAARAAKEADEVEDFLLGAAA